MDRLLKGVVLLDGINVNTLQLDNRFNMSLECVELPQPGSLSTSLSLLRDFRLLMLLGLVGFSNLETVKCALSHGPFSFPFTPSIVLLCCECSLHIYQHNKKLHLAKNNINNTALVFLCISNKFTFFVPVIRNND